MQMTLIDVQVVIVDQCGASIAWLSGLHQDKMIMKPTLGSPQSVLVRCAELHFVFSMFVWLNMNKIPENSYCNY